LLRIDEFFMFTPQDERPFHAGLALEKRRGWKLRYSSPQPRCAALMNSISLLHSLHTYTHNYAVTRLSHFCNSAQRRESLQKLRFRLGSG
jgi:hypothetical protein